MIRYYLGEEPILPIVETICYATLSQAKWSCADLDRYVIKPTGASGGYGVVIGPRASEDELAETRKRIERNPAALHSAAHDSPVGASNARRGRKRQRPNARATACRFASVRDAGEQTSRIAGRTDARRAARRFDGGEFVTRRRQQGYLGSGAIVLRRIAGDLFWTMRYLERAQWRARLLDVNYRLLLEVPPRDADPWEPLVADHRRDGSVRSASQPCGRDLGAAILHLRSREQILDSMLYRARA